MRPSRRTRACAPRGARALEAPVASPLLRVAAAVGNAGLVPEDYARGFVFVMKHSEARRAFLLGELSDRGFPHYFLVTFLLKTPVPLLLLTALALARLGRLGRRDAAFLWLPVLVYAASLSPAACRSVTGTSCPSTRSSSSRRARPRPGSGPGAGPPASRWWLGSGSGTRGGRSAITRTTWPTSTSSPAGRPTAGGVLVDSNLDWGQDLKRLAAWMRQNGITRVKLSYFGSADPSYYGIDAEALPGYTAPHAPRVTREIRPGDIVAVSATNLQGVYLEPEDRALMARLRALEPIGRAGWSIRVYRADFAWPEPGVPAAGASGP